MAKWSFTIDSGKERISVEGHSPRSAAVRYLMGRRRSLLTTKDPASVKKLFSVLPTKISIIGPGVSKTYNVSWERVGRGMLNGARFTFTLDTANEPTSEARGFFGRLTVLTGRLLRPH